MNRQAANVLPRVKVALYFDGCCLVGDNEYNNRVLSIAISRKDANEIAELYNNPATHEQGVARLAEVEFK